MIKTTITAKRPNGEIETVDASARFPRGINDGMFAKMRSATREAGRGELLSYEVEVIDDRSEADKAWDEVERLRDRAAAADYPAKAIPLAKQADDAAAQWAADYPAEHAERIAAEQRRRDEIASRPGTLAMLEGRD